MNKIINLEKLDLFAGIINTLKSDKDVDATTGNFAKFDENGNPVDSGINVNDLSLVATSGDYNDLSNKPNIPSVGNAEIEIQKNGTKVNSFTTNQSGSKVNINITVPTGTAADKNVPSSGNASSTEVVMGNDTRLSDSRPASDVYSWAKQSSKPSYSFSEIGGTVSSSQLPSYVDDILEYTAKSDFPNPGESGKIYVAKDTNLTWRWGGSDYVEISPSLALGETSSTAYAGDKGKALADKLAGIESGALVHKAPTTEEVKSALGTGSGTSKYLREDGQWVTPPDTNTWRPVSDSVSSTDDSTAASSKAVKTAYDLAASTDSALTSHTTDTTVHITSAERTSWNNAINDLNSQSETIAAAIVDLNNTKLDASEYVPTDLSNYYTKSETNSKTEILNALAGKANTATTLSGYGITDAYTKSETYTKTEIQNALNEKVNTADVVTAITPSNSDSTNPIATKVVVENEKVIAEALIDLDERKLDASEYVPTDLSNYYTKSETNSKTEILSALDGKTDNSAFTVHTSDTTAHITAAERTSWNTVTTKADNSALTAHTTDTNIHVTAAEKTSWNNAVTSISDLSGQSETIAAALVELNNRISQLEEQLENLSNN